MNVPEEHGIIKFKQTYEYLYGSYVSEISYEIVELDTDINTNIITYKIILNNPLHININIDVNKSNYMNITGIIPLMDNSNSQYTQYGCWKCHLSSSLLYFDTFNIMNQIYYIDTKTQKSNAIEVDLHNIDKDILKKLLSCSDKCIIDLHNKIKMYYLCVNVLNKWKYVLNKYLTHNIFIDTFKCDIIMILNDVSKTNYLLHC